MVMVAVAFYAPLFPLAGDIWYIWSTHQHLIDRTWDEFLPRPVGKKKIASWKNKGQKSRITILWKKIHRQKTIPRQQRFPNVP